MKAEIINRGTYQQVAAAHEVYSNLIDIYEDILGGPRNCMGIPEYYAAISSRRLCEQRLDQLFNEL